MLSRLFQAITITTILVLCAAAAQAQTKIYAGFINGSFDLGITNNQGVNGAAQVTLYGYEGVRLEAVGDVSAYLRNHEKVYIYLAGPQVSFDVFDGRLTPFARIMFGATRYDGATYYAHSVGGGLDINVSKRFFIRGFQYDKQSTDKY